MTERSNHQEADMDDSHYEPGPYGRAALLIRNWWAIGLRGGFAVLFGLVALLLPGLTLETMVILFGAYMLTDGVWAIMSGLWAATRHERWALLVCEGALNLVAAGIALLAPVATVVALVYLAGVWAILTGATLFAAAFALRMIDGRWLMALGAAVSVLWGALLLYRPIPGALVMTWWLGGYAIVFGATLLGLAARLWNAGQPTRVNRPLPRMGPF